MTPAEMAALHAKCFTTPRPYKTSEFESTLKGIGVFAITRPHGFLIGRVIADQSELITLAVDPDFRRQGIARELVDAFIGTSHRMGAEMAFLEVSETNTAAQTLYESFDFIENDRRVGYYRTPKGSRLDAITMMRDL